MITLRGRIAAGRNGVVMEHPEVFYPSEKYEERLHTLQPVYSLTAGLTNNAVSKAVRQVIDGLDLTRDTLPREIRLKYELAEYNYAVRGIHFPGDKEVFCHARDRLAKGEGLYEAVQGAKDYVTMAIAHSLSIGKGNGPTHHFWRFFPG